MLRHLAFVRQEVAEEIRVRPVALQLQLAAAPQRHQRQATGARQRQGEVGVQPLFLLQHRQRQRGVDPLAQRSHAGARFKRHRLRHCQRGNALDAARVAQRHQQERLADGHVGALQIRQLRLAETHLEVQRPLVNLRLINAQLAHLHIRRALYLKRLRQQIAVMLHPLHYRLSFLVFLLFAFDIGNDNQRTEHALRPAGAFAHLPDHALPIAAAFVDHAHQLGDGDQHHHHQSQQRGYFPEKYRFHHARSS